MARIKFAKPSIGTITGDADYERVRKKAAYLTPTPGGVGPVTVTMPLEDIMIAAERSS